MKVLYADEEQVGEKVHAEILYASSNDQEVTISSTFEDIVRCGYDPNDISVTPLRLLGNIVENGERLLVKIRFENLGNYFANKVSIEQQLDENLDASTIKVLESSHSYKMMTARSAQDINSMKFLFDDIMLPGSNDPIRANREGYIIYSVALKPNLGIGTKINHSAEIVFDLNRPIETNTFTNVVGILG